MSEGTTMADETKYASADEELAALRARRDAREARRQKEYDDQELELLRLSEKFEESLGAQGKEFEVVDLRNVGEGFFVVKRADPIAHKRWTAAINKAMAKDRPIDEAEYATYVADNIVHPSRAAYLDVASRRPILHARCANALMALAASQREERAGKY